MKKSTLLLVAAIIGTVFAAVSLILLPRIGITPVILSTVSSVIATGVAWAGWKTNNRVFALFSGIIYLISIVLMPSVGFIAFNIVQMILCFVAYGTWRK